MIRKLGIALLILLVPLAAFGQTRDGKTVEAPGFPEDYREAPDGPPPGKEILKYAEDGEEGAQRNFGVQPIHDNAPFFTFSTDRFEYHLKDDEDTFLWDLEAWFGGDYNKLYVESEGESFADGKVEEAELEVLYTRTLTTFWDLQLGVRHDVKPEPSRTFADFGFQGMMPQWFEVEANLFVSEEGDVSAKLEAEYDVLLSQRLVMQPRFETKLAAQSVPEQHVGSGINDITFGGRLRYEILREFAPYVGATWTRKLGETADMAEEEGEDLGEPAFVLGVKFWF